MAARTGSSPPGLQGTEEPAAKIPEVLGWQRNPPAPGQTLLTLRFSRQPLGCAFRLASCPYRGAMGFIPLSPRTPRCLPAPCSCLRHTPLPGARCGPQSGCCPISDRSLKDLIPQSQLFTPRWCCPSALPRCPITIGELPKSPSRNFTGFGTHLGWRDTNTFHSFRIEEEGGSR